MPTPGSDADGNPVVVYSRCAQEPPNLSGSPGGTDFGAGPSSDWQTARGCDVFELSLTGRPVEHKLTAASSKTQSETTPSMWRGGLAFARHADGSANTKLLYLPMARRSRARSVAAPFRPARRAAAPCRAIAASISSTSVRRAPCSCGA